MSKPKSASSHDAKAADTQHHAMRETVESIVVAVILAFLLRSFLVEPFVIPTGSMAPTLQGRHKDVECEQCGQPFRAGASSENDDNHFQRTVIAAICPNCRHRMVMRPDLNSNEKSFNGDRIVVNKFAYDLRDPRRWDVIVFKFPGNAVQNYIKRLIGLPNETIRIYHGDIYVKGPGEEGFRIARKPEDKHLAMLQLVNDSRHVADTLMEAGWPHRWQPWSPAGIPEESATEVFENGRRYAINAPKDEQVWLRYHHVVPSLEDWLELEGGQAPRVVNRRMGQLITDFYAYNASITVPRGAKYDPTIPPEQYTGDILIGTDTPLIDGDNSDVWGLHWVGDLALETEIEVKDGSGFLLLDLVEGGLHHQCRINVADGTAELTIDEGRVPFDGEAAAEKRTASTPLKGPGDYDVRYSNVDDELRLWIDGKLVTFDGPTTFTVPDSQVPKWSPTDPGDLAPLGIGAEGLSLELNRLRVLRDVYYLAVSRHWDNQTPSIDHDYDLFVSKSDILGVLADPMAWESTDLFRSRRAVQFEMKDEQYFPMGDNSPQSADARSWDPPPYVERDMLLGRAVLIYWPHGWNRPVPFTPNFRRMGVIR